jgi:hypothetical protein
MLPSSSIQFSARRRLAAVAIAFFVAAGFVQFDWTPRAAPAVSRAGIEMMQMLRDDHATIAAYLKSETEAQRVANAAAAHELEGMKLAARADASAGPRIAQVEREPKRVMAATEKKTAPAKLEPVHVATAIAPGEPMQLLQIQAAAPPSSRAPLVGVAVGAVSGQLRQLAATVEHVPSWLVSAGDWVSDAVPVSRRPNWASREFRATL